MSWVWFGLLWFSWSLIWYSCILFAWFCLVKVDVIWLGSGSLGASNSVLSSQARVTWAIWQSDVIWLNFIWFCPQTNKQNDYLWIYTLTGQTKLQTDWSIELMRNSPNKQDRKLNWIAERDYFTKLWLTHSLSDICVSKDSRAELSYPKNLKLI